jgi:hypothetical protein
MVGSVNMTEKDLEGYWLQADAAERVIYQSGETITGSNLHCELIASLSRTIRALVQHIRDEKQPKKD